MKNKNVIFKISITLVSILIISIILLVFLGKKERLGYLSEFKLISSNNSLEYIYDFRIKYYSEVFRNSDIYGVYVDTNKLMEDNNFIKEIKMYNKGGPFGYIISSKIIDTDKNYDIYYFLKVKKEIIFYVISIFLSLIFVYFINNKNITKKYLIYFCIFSIFIFSISVRIYWANQKELLHEDEYFSISFINSQKWPSIDLNSINNTSGKDILKSIMMPDASISGCINDIKELYKNTNDPQISNLYYSFLRLFFIGTDSVNIKELIIRGAILNCIFFLISYIFLYKLLKMLFEDKNEYILFFLIIMSLSPASITFSHFLRPYQMQEMFFIVITYIVIYTIYYNKYSIVNLLLTSLITGFGYLILTSSMLFVFILSFMLFFNYILTLIKNRRKQYVLYPLIEIKSYKIILYYATAFISALLVSRIFYTNFFGMLFNNGDRALTTINFSGDIFKLINIYAFNGLFIFILIFITSILIRKTKYVIDVNKDKMNLVFFIIILSIVYIISSNLISPYKYQLRYSGVSYILLLFMFIIIFSFIESNKKLKYILMLFISIIYIYRITDYNSFFYFYKKDNELDVLKENIPVYMYKTFYYNYVYGYTYSYSYINTNLYYTYIDDEKKLNDITNSNEFYFVIPMKYSNLLFKDIFNNYYKNRILFYDNTYLFKLEKINCN
ncbi:hypothetical protein NEI02_06290 [Brachyspira pilosicoli]|uniref:Uncharacterized protein n=1 Tax=Brachyspira pilosicoli TaxID=52584 RepID=A0AAJ6G6R8_BRAPL|nr:hypothetical protein [Brachyspira pilosicoli]WIH89312.1 hypothetical protein NEI02_06290 [Brachyspira pilosicoli]WIH91607.1 hypothetical protein NEI01_06290 [Brachyspira pilosicoli]WIH93896.1 hypothetical protein NEH99_06270 [Brachyspira pilosicoli]